MLFLESLVTGSLEEIFILCLIGGCGSSLLFGFSATRFAGPLTPRIGRRGLPRFLSPARWLARCVPTRLFRATPNPSRTACWSWAVPLGVSSLSTAFGASGLVLRVLGAQSAFVSVVGASFSAAGISLFALWTASRLAAETADEIQGETLPFTSGRVCVSIPPGGVGAISYVAHGRRVSMPARSTDGEPLKLGAPVVVVECAERIAIVESDCEVER
ncbi:MAG: hypothetical protein N2C14_09070 [Planctomycetales bacterium]